MLFPTLVLHALGIVVLTCVEDIVMDFFNGKYEYIWANYNDLIVLPSPGIMVNKGNHPKMALFQVSEWL